MAIPPPAVCDAEYHVGLVPYDFSDSVAAANTAKLNGALNAMWTGGSFPFASGGAGPILRPIVAAAKEFYFKGTIKTSRKIGGALIGSMLSRGFSTTSSSYQFPNLHPYPNLMGGAQTRFTRLDGQNGGAVLRLRGSGFHVQGIEFKGQKYYYGAPEGTATPSGIEVEGNLNDTSKRPAQYASAVTGRHVIRQCLISHCTYGIRCLAGYYDDSEVLQPFENHADNGIVDGVAFYGVDSVFRSENQQAVVWSLRDIDVNCTAATILDLPRGGNVWVNGLSGNVEKMTLLSVRDWSQNNARITLENVKWDHTDQSPVSSLTLFKYTGFTGALAGFTWSVRITGQLNNFYNPGTSGFDDSKLIDLPKGVTSFSFDDILIDMYGLPEKKFKRQGRWLVPTNAWLA